MTFSELVDCSNEEFLDFCKDKELGYLMGLFNLFAKTYEEVREIKDGIVEKIVAGTDAGENTDDHQKVLIGLYSKMFLIEEKAFIVKEAIGKRNLEFDSV